MSQCFNFINKLSLRFFPRLFLKYGAKKQKVDPKKLDWAVKLFGDCERIDISRTATSDRGFILTLDKKMRLFFYQDGDHFSFDGYEIGEYENGEVTIFDNLGK